MANELMTSTMAFDLNEFQHTGIATSLPSETEDDKIRLYNAFNTADVKLADEIGHPLEITHFVAHMVTLTSDETGIESDQPRIILIDKNGKTYGCVSAGIFTALKRLVAMYGPGPWTDKPLRLEPYFSQGKQNRRVLGLRLLPQDKKK